MGNTLSPNPLPYKPRKDFRLRFEEKYQVLPNGCWEWTAGKTSDGYGCFSVGGRRGSMRSAHIVSYELHVGAVPAGKELDHTCRNRACVNPAHLDPVPHAVNTDRGHHPNVLASKNGVCRRGHQMTFENTIFLSNGGKTCRACVRANARKNYRKRQDAKFLDRYSDDELRAMGESA